jgi:hypothetical protein
LPESTDRRQRCVAREHATKQEAQFSREQSVSEIAEPVKQADAQERLVCEVPRGRFLRFEIVRSRPRDRQLAKIAPIFDFGGAARKPLAQGVRPIGYDESGAQRKGERPG